MPLFAAGGITDVLHSRPMTTIERDFDGSLWFFARADSAAVGALASHPQVSLSYSDHGASSFVAVAGPASVVTDMDKKKALWSPAVQAWFPDGPESSQYVLVHVEPDHAEYWDSSSNKLTRMMLMAKALATGTPPHEQTEHRTVRMAESATLAQAR